jgi:Haem-binding domain
MIKKIAYIVLALLVIIQFIRPARNISTIESPTHIGKQYTIPEPVEAILEKACFDCHSNNTVYPWYANVQPVGFWLDDHVKDGKRELNFSEFLSYSPKKARHKMVELIDQVKEGEMPLNSYTWIHTSSKLSQEEKAELSAWADAIAKQIASENNLPPSEPKSDGPPERD